MKTGHVRFLLCLLLQSGSMLLAGCGTTFGEVHYYQLTENSTDRVTNYFRLKVKGYAAFSSARYVSGYYDERAVNMFFNEMKLAPTDTTNPDTRAIAVDQKEPGTDRKITPLTPTEGNGTLVMVLSSNASSVTNAIGQFAENQVVADAVTNLANRELIAADIRQNQAKKLELNATASTVDKLMGQVPSDASPDKEQTIGTYLRVLNAISRALTPGQESFTNLDDAEAWLAQLKVEVQ